MNLLILVLILVFSSVIYVTDDVHTLGQIYFYATAIHSVYLLYKSKKVQLILIWNIAFIFIILSEVLLLETVGHYTVESVKYLLLANNVVNLGYIVNLKSSSNFQFSSNLKTKNPKIVTPLLIGVVLFYFANKIQEALYTFSVGRNVVISEGEGSGFFLGSIFNSIGFVLPAIIAYYFIFIKKNNLILAILLSIPIFIIQFLAGSRFPLLFSLLGFFVVLQTRYFKKMRLKQYLIAMLVVASIGYLSTLMKHYRSSTTRDEQIVIFSNKTSDADFPTLLATNFMSPEGVVDMTSLMFSHFQVNEHLYGSSSSFLLYFWIPRQIWADKPTMLGYWFIREYRVGFSAGHSASFGFSGDLYADFGLFSLIFIFFIGYFLRYADNFKDAAFRKGGYNIIIGAMLFPYVFFFVRSPITSTMNFIGITLIYLIFKKILFRKPLIK